MQAYPVSKRGRLVQPGFFGVLAISIPAALPAALAEPPVSRALTEPFSVSGMLHVLLALIIVLALLCVGVVLLRRYGRFREGPSGRLRIVDGLALGTRDRLLLVEIDKEQVLLGVSPGNIQALHVVGSSSEKRSRLEFQDQLLECLRQTSKETK